MMLITPSSPPPESRLIREPSHSHSADGATELWKPPFSLSFPIILLHSRPISSKEKRNHGSIDKRTRKSVRQKRDGCRSCSTSFLYIYWAYDCVHTHFFNWATLYARKEKKVMTNKAHLWSIITARWLTKKRKERVQRENSSSSSRSISFESRAGMLTDVPQPRDSYRRDDGGGSSTRANRSRQVLVFFFLSTCSRAYLKME